MHETALVRSLLAQVEHLRHEHGGASVERIVVEIGPLSGVEPLLVRGAFEEFAPLTDTAATAELQIEETPLAAECNGCQAEFKIPAFQFVCPACGSTAVRVTRGDEFRLLSVDIAVPAEDARSG
jgi:hydrogenase nickel incorporation protein HypA/HybF